MLIITDLLIKLFVKNPDCVHDRSVRTGYGNFTSIVGIICNIFLCLIKGAAGFAFNSVAIIADAVNNLSDAGNLIISLISFMIADKPADENHPYGHARIEYIACMLVSFAILGMGITLLRSSIVKIITPDKLNTSFISVAVLIVSILVKLWMSLFYKKVGNRINSSIILANSADSLNDVISTSAVLITTIIALFTDINLDAYAGCAVALFILYSGYGILKDTLNHLLGTMPDSQLITEITQKLSSYNGVMGIHDLVVHSYGPDNYFATVHVEVPGNVNILTSHDMIDNIERDFLNELNINLVIHLDPIITDDEKTNEMKEMIKNIVKNIDSRFTIHDFRMVKGETHSNLIFDVVVPASYKPSQNELISKIERRVKEIDETLFTVITIDRNYTKS